MNLKERFSDVLVFKKSAIFLGIVVFAVFFVVSVGIVWLLSIFFKYDLYEYANRAMAISLLLSLAIGIWYFDFALKRQKFLCPHCLTWIFLYKITDITCPECNQPGKNYIHLFGKCDCGESIDYYECPHCKEPISLLSKYDLYKLESKKHGKKNSKK